MAETQTYAHIIADPGVCSGLPRIAGTRVRILDIVARHREGLSPAEILDCYEHLTLGQVHGALAYYYDHREEVDRQFVESRRRAEEFRQEHPESVR